jgi:hypothetical protein
MTPGRGKLRFAKALWLDPLDAGVHDADELQRREDPLRQRPQDVCLLGVVDIQPVLAQHADPEDDLLCIFGKIFLEVFNRSCGLITCR